MPAGRALRDAAVRALDAQWFIPVVMLLGIVTRLAWVFLVDAQPVDDFTWYFDRGIDLAAGRGLIDPAGEPTAYWPVGYPLMLAALFRVFGVSILAAKLANVALYAGIMICAYIVARRAIRHELSARLVLLALALYPNHVAYASLIATETPFLFFMLLGTLLLLLSRERTWLSLAAGAVFGLGCLVKPTMLFVPLVVLWSEWFARLRGRLFARALLVHLALIAVVAPWIARNGRIYDTFVFINTNGGINLLIGNNPDATGGYMATIDPALEQRLEAAGNEQRRDALAQQIALQYIREHPVETIARLPMKLWYFYYKDVEGFYWNEVALGVGAGTPMQRPLAALKIAAQAAWILVLVSWLAGVLLFHVFRRPGPGREALLGPWIILYFTLLTLALFGSTRLHFPLVPFLLFHAAAGWSVLLGRHGDTLRIAPLLRADPCIVVSSSSQRTG